MFATFGVVLLVALVLSTVLGVGVLGLTLWGMAKGVRALGSAARRLLGGQTEDDAKAHTPPSPTGVEDEPTPRQRATTQARTSATHPQTRDYEYLDVEHGATPEHIMDVMQSYVDDYVAGDYAQAVIEALSTAEFRRKRLFSEIDSKFARNSLSWERFASTATAALDAVLRNSALLANRVQAFDSTDYARMEQFYTSGGFSANGSQDAARLQRWKLLDETKREMDDIRSTNESLLLELGKLAAELGKLSSAEYHDEGARIAEEVGKLVDETKYYR